MKAAVVSFPGSNCDRDCMDAARLAYGVEPAFVFHKDGGLPPCDVIFIAGGFSYGDYLRAGAMAARSAIMGEIRKAAERGVPVAGICNGFQILCEAGLLPGALVRNAGRKFVCRREALTVETTASPFTAGYARGQTAHFVTSHHDGCYLADEATLDRLEGEDRVAFRYQDNPNGSARDIAGVLSADRRILGLMPHPDRAVDPMTVGGAEGLAFFTGVAQAMAA